MADKESRESFTDWYEYEHPEDKHQDAAVDLAYQAWQAAKKDARDILASTLISQLSLVRGRPVEWTEAVEISAIVTGMEEDEKQRLLDMDGA